MKFEIVISHYKENLNWVSSLPKSLDVKIYNKFEGENLLPNVGRESHTYLTHIIENYENLSDITVFVQGNPYEHSKNFDQLIVDENLLNKNYSYVGLSDGVITCDENGRPHCGERHLPLGKLYEWIFNKSSPEVFMCNSAGQFRVTKEAIRQNPIEVYTRALQSVSYDVNPIEGFCLERMWLTIFGYKDTRKRSQLDYRNDSFFSKERYFGECMIKGDFIKLGDLGPYAKL